MHATVFDVAVEEPDGTEDRWSGDLPALPAVGQRLWIDGGAWIVERIEFVLTLYHGTMEGQPGPAHVEIHARREAA